MADGGDAATELPAVLESAGDKPRALHRFIHAGPELRSLDAPNAVLATLRRKDVPPARSWRAFTDSEDARLAQAWDQLEHDRAGEPQVAGEPRFVQEPEQLALDDDDGAAHVVPVGLDQLFSVDLRAMTLEPAFWRGQGVRVRRALWFYPPASAGDRTTAMPVYPVDDELADALERAYDYIKPWSASYDAELHSALELGASAQARVKVALDTHAEADAPSMDVIFESDNSGRIYSGILGTVGKSFFTSATGLGGGQLVLRGWDAVRDHAEARRPRERQRSQSVDTDAVKAEPAQEGGGFLAALRARLNRAGSPAPDHEVRNETSEAMDTGRNNAETQDDIGDVDELVLIVHGIGQQLASTHEGFSFVHAVNRFRAISTDLSTSSSSTLTPLLGRKRAQFIPVMWRTDLDFDEPASDRDDTAEERLENSFSLRDIEVQGSIPLLRQVVSGLVLDVPFYLSRHRPKMVRALVTKANGIYRRWCARHPGFAEKGRVSIIAHSLGSVLCADVLSAQPTLVKPFDDMTIDERRAEHSFVFDTRIMFLAGSPLSFFVHLNQGQLIARKGRAHTRHAAPDIALDRAGRYGCMAVESVYNTYYGAPLSPRLALQ